MKNILILAVLATLGLVHVQAEESVESCKAYISEAKSFQSTMDTSKVSKATFAFYKDKVLTHCGNIANKMPFERSFFTNTLMKKDTTTISNCKIAIDMAKDYEASINKSSFIANAHKINIADNCGTLVAKKSPVFCLYDK